MTMVCKAQDPAMLDAVKAGDKTGSMPPGERRFTVTRIEKAK